MNALRITGLIFLLGVTGQAQHNQHVTSEGNPTAIVIFMAVDCPVTQKYMHTVKSIAHLYQNKISVTGYFPAGLTRKTERQFRKEYKLPGLIKLVDDKEHTVTNRFGATITPEVFLLDKEGRILYSGAIDNWFFELGRYRPEITENYLRDAINSCLEGKLPAITKTTAIGCFIQQIKTPNQMHQH
ncbi:MAG TPA: redoxin domain-containing protein [Cyclobacteriaceae bacterium]|mgnify:CR=1 FL=1|jgi:thiol-disulfide isomerase/thioredoxin|nr:redoxin domain-containing protein [Cytophagales bacterium]HMR56217.1 redoxin domain-containing protein [Cyclobacteriaceae bacterium]HRE65642.1 redoxin domain-containing protein [Cyclobacteriaceae bacterium]HRF34746.1 redoxin domain-containing protein [Cyclobacteriaceae bacterium]